MAESHSKVGFSGPMWRKSICRLRFNLPNTDCGSPYQQVFLEAMNPFHSIIIPEFDGVGLVFLAAGYMVLRGMCLVISAANSTLSPHHEFESAWYSIINCIYMV